MEKKEFPIIEFDESRISFIEPSLIKNKYPKLPKSLIICFFKEVIDALLKNNEIHHSFTIFGENDYVFYVFNDFDCAIIHGHVGGPSCGGILEEAIALGVEKVMFCGGGGALRSDIVVGKLIVVDSAVRDEGTSYHYLKPSREVVANKEVNSAIETYFKNHHIDYILGKVWTTDAFYRETMQRVALRKEEGCLLVEMEQASLLAISQFRNIKYGAIIYGGDDLSKAVWDNRSWSSREDVRLNLMRICLDIVISL